MTEEIIEKELWDHYSELPNPAWYEYKNNIHMVEIHPCKECGNEEGIQLKDEVTLAECSICQHLSDVKTPNDV